VVQCVEQAHLLGCFFFGYKGGKIYWLAIHSNQANLIVGGLRTAATSRHAKRPFSRRCPPPWAVFTSVCCVTAVCCVNRLLLH
jgi:hypothetical protein